MVAVAKIQFKFDCEQELKEGIESVFRAHPTSNTVGMSRILEWFLSQPPLFRLAILQRDRELQAELSKQLLEQMAGGVAGRIGSSRQVRGKNAASAIPKIRGVPRDDKPSQ